MTSTIKDYVVKAEQYWQSSARNRWKVNIYRIEERNGKPFRAIVYCSPEMTKAQAISMTSYVERIFYAALRSLTEDLAAVLKEQLEKGSHGNKLVAVETTEEPEEPEQ